VGRCIRGESSQDSGDEEDCFDVFTDFHDLLQVVK
jgi:hypothetical protein